MNLFVAGCSFSYGPNQFEADYIWPNLCKQNFDKVTNTSLCGSNNLRSLRNFLDYVDKNNFCKDTVYVLQLTDKLRGSFYNEKFKEWGNFIKENYFLEPDSDLLKDENFFDNQRIGNNFKKYVLPYNLIFRNEEYCEYETMNIINTFISVCEKHDLKYLITAMSSLCFPSENNLTKFIKSSDNIIEAISRIARDNTLNDADVGGHPNADGHRLFYRYIMSEIEKRWQI